MAYCDRTNGTDFAGYPNGRRPKDDIVDISLVAVMGGLCVANGKGNTNALGFGTACNSGALPLGAKAFKLHDGVDQAVVPLLPGFPYLNTPIRVRSRRPAAAARRFNDALSSCASNTCHPLRKRLVAERAAGRCAFDRRHRRGIL